MMSTVNIPYENSEPNYRDIRNVTRKETFKQILIELNSSFFFLIRFNQVVQKKMSNEFLRRVLSGLVSNHEDDDNDNNRNTLLVSKR